MTNIEAIEKLSFLSDYCKLVFSDKNKPGSLESIKIAIKSIEKQIPKKPISYDDCEQFVIRCTCGKCTDTRFFHGYCTWCGQKLSN